jgi:type I restriction enzyme M protein
MAKKAVGGSEVKKLEEMMWAFETRYSVDITTAFNGLLDYIIGYFDPTGQPIEGWRFNKEQNAEFHAMMCEYMQTMDRMLQSREWFDAWGDLFMALYANGAGKEQFFTPMSLVDLMTQVCVRNDIGEPTLRCGGFGKRHAISDPACGSSRNLLAAHLAYQKQYNRNAYISGEDLDSTCCKMSAVNMMMHGCFGEVVCHNTLSEPDIVRAGYIINETMYPFPTPVPSIRRSTNPNEFVCTSAMLELKKQHEKPKEEIKPKPKAAEPKAEAPIEETKPKQPQQLTLW